MADRKVFANQGPVKPDIRRSGYDLSHANNLTVRLGRIYPDLLYDAPAGSSFKIRAKAAFDLEPLQFPIQSNIRMHQKFYKIPKRILWKNFKYFVGQHGNHVLPYVKRAGDWTATGTLADYMGICSNKVGVVDSDYRGEIMVSLHNHSNAEQSITDGERIAQMVITPFLKVEYTEVDELTDTVRGEGGFGSTGKK